MQSHEYSQPDESEFSVNGNSEASTAGGDDERSLDSNTQLNDDNTQNTSRADESPEGSNNEIPDSQLPHDEAREEAWAVHNAKTSASQEALFERFRNNEGIKAPTSAETNQ